MMTTRLGLVYVAACALALGCGSVKDPEGSADAAAPQIDAMVGCGALTDCSGTCVDTDTDDNNCGMCDRMCDTGTECVAGDCECVAGTVDCSGTCIDPLTDNGFCGAGNDCSAEPGVVCDPDSMCLDGVCRRSLQNGSFETGDYTGWVIGDDQPGQPAVGIWALLMAGTDLSASPLTLFDHQDAGDQVANCPAGTSTVIPLSIVSDGTWAGMHTQNDSGRHHLMQTIFVRPGETSLSWDMAWATGGLDPTTQFLALNIYDSASNLLDTPFKVGDQMAGDLPNQATFTNVSVDLTPYQGMEIQFELELMVIQDCFTVFFDNFRVQ